eukprot:TRINITY_DN7838_c0_g2_i4.p1 TRINITY_DN7838_c0_g2~~TRINITY_DN7838_c0_g2_i4.p1  ORF type:complete len:467 (+),score=120.22 TRINITY_DN7838_c0_g2_i4:158-1558(+)
MKRKKKLKMSLAQVDMEGKFPPAFSVVVENVLAASGIPDGESMPVQLENLRQNKGVRAVLSLTEDALPLGILEAKGMRYLHLSTVDLTPPSLLQLWQGATFIDDVHRDTDGATLVHCREGVGRSGTMLAAWFIISRGMGAQEAIDHVRSLRSGAIHMKHQERRLFQLHRVCSDEDLRRQLAAGGLDESRWDFGVIKAHSAQLLARVTEHFFATLCYAKWQAWVAAARGRPDQRPKFLEPQRSPVWRPRVKNLFSPGSGGRSPPLSPDTEDSLQGVASEEAEEVNTQLVVETSPSFQIGSGRRERKGAARGKEGADGPVCTIGRSRKAAAQGGEPRCLPSCAPTAVSPAPPPCILHDSPAAPEHAPQFTPTPPAAPPAARPARAGATSPPTATVEAALQRATHPMHVNPSRPADVSYLQDQGVPQLMLHAVRELLVARPQSPRVFFAQWFSERRAAAAAGGAAPPAH